MKKQYCATHPNYTAEHHFSVLIAFDRCLQLVPDTHRIRRLPILTQEVLAIQTTGTSHFAHSYANFALSIGSNLPSCKKKNCKPSQPCRKKHIVANKDAALVLYNTHLAWIVPYPCHISRRNSSQTTPPRKPSRE